MVGPRYPSAACLLVAVAVAAPALAAAQNDAGTGTDAPAYPESLPAEEGLGSGALLVSQGDFEDGYRFSAPPADRWRRVHMESADGASSVRIRANGSGAYSVTLGGRFELELYVRDSDVRVWVGEDTDDVHYSIMSEVASPSDVYVDRVAVVVPPGGIESGPKWVDVDLTNEGARDPWVHLTVRAESGQGSRTIASGRYLLEAGSRSDLRFIFDDTGMVGNVRIVAEVDPLLDPTAEGWLAGTDWRALVDAAGFDALGQSARVDPSDGSWVEVRQETHGAYLDSSHYARAIVHHDGTYVYASAGQCRLWACVGAGVWPFPPSP